MQFECQVTNVALNTSTNFFIAAQFKIQSQDITQPTQKLRTQVAYTTNRPKFNKNLFKFQIRGRGTLKLGVMHTTGDSPQQIRKAMVFGVNSIKIEQRRLRQLPNGQFKTPFNFMDRGKEVGACNLKIKIVSVQGVPLTTFKPLISRVLYNPELRDPQVIKNNLMLVDQQLKKVHQNFQKIKKQQTHWENLYMILEKDQQQLKDQIFAIQKINSKISNKLTIRESIEELQMQIQMLKNTQAGRNLLLEKIEYFEDRIFREDQQNQSLTIKYEKMRPIIQINLNRAQQHSQKLKGKQIQQFQLQKNEQILRTYEDVLYEFKCNQQTIGSLAKMSKRSEHTANQAALLLSQVTYQVKLAQLDLIQDKEQQKLLKRIEKKAEIPLKQQKLSQQEQIIYKIKLQALQRQIQIVRDKIRKIS